MKKLLVFALLLALPLSLAWGYSSGPPNDRAGNPPQNANCTACHSSFPVNSGNGSLNITELFEYVPGETYDLEISLSDPDQSRWGFELTVQNMQNAYAGGLTVTNAQQTQLNGSFLKHTSNGTFQNQNSGTWAFQWTAPAEGTGDVTFYVAGNAANNNGSTSGDYIYTVFQSVVEAAGNQDPDINLPELAHNFGNVMIGQTATWDMTIQNTGGADLSITSISTLTEFFSVDFTDAITIGAGAEETVTVTFAPGNAGFADDMLQIASNDPDEANLTVSLEGTGEVGARPDAFSLLTPADDAQIPGDVISFSWEEAVDPDEGDVVTYTVEMSVDENFTDPMTFNAGPNLFVTAGDQAPGMYWWRVHAQDTNSPGRYSTETFTFTLGETFVAEGGDGMISDFAISEIYPNPFNPEVTIEVAVPFSAQLTLEVYDVLGRQVAVLHNGVLQTGLHSFNWRANGPAGIYLLNASNQQGWHDIRKLMFVK
ncbi:choice-of-anchor D domain-containing protein [bacterium]|nr:choice-of-anchor D domain-containing protein [bacterium]